MSDTADRNVELETELRKSRAELQETRAQLERLRGERERASQRSRTLGRWGLRLLAGRELRTSSRAWFARLAGLQSPRDLASPESADLLAAFGRRVLRIGFFGLVVGAFAVVTPIVTLWQSFLIREQNKTMQEQVDQQTADNLIVRRAQLLATIYEEDCSAPPPEPSGGEDTPERVCAPRSHLRARQEAVLAFVEIERGRGARSNLSRVNLSGADLRDADLTGPSTEVVASSVLSYGAKSTSLSKKYLSRLAADINRMGNIYEDADGRLIREGPIMFYATDLSGANLSATDFRGADLAGANLIGADLTDANLLSANLIGASLIGANLDGAILVGANLTGVSLRGASLTEVNLDGANLSGANLIGSDLKKEQIVSARVDSETKLPSGWTSPES